MPPALLSDTNTPSHHEPVSTSAEHAVQHSELSATCSVGQVLQDSGVPTTEFACTLSCACHVTELSHDERSYTWGLLVFWPAKACIILLLLSLWRVVSDTAGQLDRDVHWQRLPKPGDVADCCCLQGLVSDTAGKHNLAVQPLSFTRLTYPLLKGTSFGLSLSPGLLTLS